MQMTRWVTVTIFKGGQRNHETRRNTSARRPHPDRQHVGLGLAVALMPRGRKATSSHLLQHHLAVSVKQAAKLIGVGKNTMYAAVAAGDVPHVKVGRRILIPVSRLEQWLEENTQGGLVLALSSAAA